MPSRFSPAVEQAIADICYCYDNQRATAALPLLQKAARAGDGDAAFLLARCLGGPAYRWKYHAFPEDAHAEELLLQWSVRQGSAMGVLGALRADVLTDQLEAEMPFPSLKAAWEAVRTMAEEGCAFAASLIGDSYYWGDMLRIEKPDMDGMLRPERIAWLRDNLNACIPWYEQAVRGGMGMAARNLFRLYLEGEEELVRPFPQEAWHLCRTCAEMGFPEWQARWGRRLRERGQASTGADWSLKAARQGQLDAWYDVGLLYQEGTMVRRNVPFALECYERCMEDPTHAECRNRAGEILFLGRGGMEKDYARAVGYFEEAQALGSDWSSPYLGLCYLLGQGCDQEPERARPLLEQTSRPSNYRLYGLGLMYADGIGVKEDVRKGVGFLREAADNGFLPAKEELKRFRRSLFGRWVHRSEEEEEEKRKK